MAGTPHLARRTTIILVLAAVAVTLAAAFAVARHLRDRKITEAPAVRVELVRTGGFANVNDRFAVDRSAPGNEELFSIVNGAEFQSLHDEYLPRDDCCDRFRYTLTVRYRDGATKTVRTVDATRAPDILWRAIRVLTSTRPVGGR